MGCMKLVGEVFKENFSIESRMKPVVLGVTNWTTIRGNESLLNKNVILQ
jgi:hypothetical protein